jgi:hypothetical protein
VKFKLFAAAALLAVSSAAQAAFNPVDFFRGRTHGTGTLKVIFSAPETIEVDNEGIAESDGSLLLKQVIHEPAKPPRVRQWHLRQTANGRFEGTLTDAASAVRVDVTKGGVRIRYTAQNHLNFDQLLTPAGPRDVRNATRIRRFGIIVAHFDEVIRKLD